MKAIKFSIMAALVAFVACMSTTYAQTADEIIKKHIDAVGGAANWDKIKTMKIVGSMNMGGQEIGMTQTIANKKGIRVDISAMGMNGYNIVTPTKGWSYMPFGGQTTVQEIPVDQLKGDMDKINVKYYALADKSFFPKSELVGKDTVNKISCFKVKISDDDGDRIAYFDEKTYYVVRMETKVKVQDEEQEMALDFSNFEKKEGVVIPMTMTTPQGDVTYKSVEINKPVSDKTFMPDETKK